MTVGGRHLRGPAAVPSGLSGAVTEEALHRACVEFLRLYEARGLLSFTHPANGAYKNPATAGLMKALGQQAGVSDLLIWAVGSRHFAVELKSDRGRLSAAQIAWMDRMAHLGFRVHVCRSLEKLQAILVAEGTPGTRNAISGQYGGEKRHHGGRGATGVTRILEQMAIAMVGGEYVWSNMSAEMRRTWLETALRGFEVVAGRITALEAERDRYRLVLGQIADPRQGDREFTAQGLAAVARSALVEGD